MMRKLGLLFCVELLFLGRGLLPRPAGSQMMRLIWPHLPFCVYNRQLHFPDDSPNEEEKRRVASPTFRPLSHFSSVRVWKAIWQAFKSQRHRVNATTAEATIKAKGRGQKRRLRRILRWVCRLQAQWSEVWLK